MKEKKITVHSAAGNGYLYPCRNNLFSNDQRYDFRQQYCQRKRTSHLLRRHTGTKDFHFL